MCKKSTTVRKYKTVGFLSWTFSVPGLWSLHCGFMDLCAAKPLPSGPVSGPEHCSITADLTGTVEFSTMHPYVTKPPNSPKLFLLS